MIRKLMPFVVFETPTENGTAAPPAAAAPPAPAPVAPPAPAGDGPWAQDLASLFPDPEVRGQVDQFLRSKVQPHVTQVEQQYAPARELWQDLQAPDQSESLGTYVAVAEQLYGPEVAKAVADSLQAQFAAEQPAAPAAAPEPPALPRETQEAIDWAQAQRAEQLYQSELARIKAVPDAPPIRDNWFANHVVGAEGDFDRALETYRAFYTEAFPNGEPAAAEPAPPAPAPPTTLTAEGAPAAIPPTNPVRETLDSALDSTLAEIRAQRQAPATVGQV